MSHYETAEIQQGGPFHCFVCGKLLAIKVDGNIFTLEMTCHRCKTFYHIHCKNPLKFKQALEEKKESAPC